VKDLWSIGSIRGCFCRGLRELERNTLQKVKVEILRRSLSDRFRMANILVWRGHKEMAAA
jgi:hypothetical protein